MSIDLPSQKPSMLTPTAQIAAPMTLAIANLRGGILPAPASIGTIVRTNGMKRASTTARGPRSFEELLRAFEVLGLEDAGVGLEQPGAEAAADRSSRAARRATAATNEPITTTAEVEVRVAELCARRAERAGEEQDRVARERRRDEPGLDEDDEDEADRPEGLDEVAWGSSQLTAMITAAHARRCTQRGGVDHDIEA